MSHAKQVSSHAKHVLKRKRRRRAVPMLGVAGLSLSLASGATAAIGGVADVPTQNIAAGHEITLCEEDVSGVSLATFNVFDKENGATFRPGVRLALGACGGGGCGGCGGCWTGTYYTSSAFGGDANPPYYSTRPARKYTHTPKTTNGSKNW